jgi:hypothetical protein
MTRPATTRPTGATGRQRQSRRFFLNRAKSLRCAGLVALVLWTSGFGCLICCAGGLVGDGCHWNERLATASCCMAEAGCCKPGAECCKNDSACCDKDSKCCTADAKCCAGDEGCSKADSKAESGCCGTACGKHKHT